MKGWDTRKLNGFTIVELLIVIVVIGILAAIVIVAYNGVSKRAQNANILSTAQSYQKALLAYNTVNTAYPPVPSSATPGADDRICLGTGYTDHTGDGIADCGNSTYPSTYYTPFDTALKSLINIPKAYDLPLKTPYQAGTFTGITLIRQDAFTVSGISNPYYMMYVLNGGNEDCKLTVVEEVSGADPFPHMKPSTQKWSWSDGSTTMCVVALPNL